MPQYPKIELVNVNKSYGSKQVLKNINLKVDAGDFLTLLGPSGSGKTTILRIIVGLEHISKGKVLKDGNDISTSKDEYVMRFVINNLMRKYNTLKKVINQE